MPVNSTAMSSNGLSWAALHALFLVYSLASLLSKLAAGFPFPSFEFLALYGGVLLILVLYALIWQQLLKRLPLATAYANKAVTVVWGMIWGVIFFGEDINGFKLAGAAFVIIGVVLFSYADFGAKKSSGPDGTQA